jgi:hypothetical protein
VTSDKPGLALQRVVDGIAEIVYEVGQPRCSGGIGCVHLELILYVNVFGFVLRALLLAGGFVVAAVADAPVHSSKYWPCLGLGL